MEVRVSNRFWFIPVYLVHVGLPLEALLQQLSVALDVVHVWRMLGILLVKALLALDYKFMH